MLSYAYTARDTATGKKIKAQVQADSVQAASKLIAEQGYTPIDISPVGAHNPFGALTNRVKPKDKILFSRQLSTLINAGLPLLQSLRTVATQTQSKPLKVIINDIIADIEAGSALSIAIQKHPGVFNQIFISLVAAGETSGTLDKALERLAAQQEQLAQSVAASTEESEQRQTAALQARFDTLRTNYDEAAGRPPIQVKTDLQVPNVDSIFNNLQYQANQREIVFRARAVGRNGEEIK